MSRTEDDLWNNVVSLSGLEAVIKKIVIKWKEVNKVKYSNMQVGPPDLHKKNNVC